MNETKRRLPEICGLNVLLCLLVIFIHCSSDALGALDKASGAYAAVMIPWRLAAFAVQGFFLLSGVKLCLSDKPLRIGKFYLSKLTKIVIPYVIWVAIYYVFFWRRNYYAFSFTDFLRYVAVGDLVAHLYFVVTIVQFYLLAPVFRSMVKRIHPAIGVTFSLLITLILSQYLPNLIDLVFPDYYFPYNDRVFTSYLFFFVAGCYIGRYYDAFKDALRQSKSVIIAAFILCAVLNGGLSYLHMSGRKTISFLELVHFAYVVSAIAFFYLLSVLWFDRHTPGKAFLTLDSMTYGIYLGHCYVIFRINMILDEFAPLRVSVSYAIRLASVYIITIGCAWLFKKARTGARILYRKVRDRSKAPAA